LLLCHVAHKRGTLASLPRAFLLLCHRVLLCHVYPRARATLARKEFSVFCMPRYWTRPVHSREAMGPLRS